MRFRIRSSWLLLLVLAPALSFAQRASSLDAVPDLLESPEAKAVWAEQMEGRPAPDHLGTRTLAGLDADRVRALILPGVDAARITLLGARRWAQHPGHVVVLACQADDAQSSAANSPATDCDTSATSQYLGVLRIDDSGTPVLRACLRLDGELTWPLLDWTGHRPLWMEDDGATSLPQRWTHFDLAAYRLSDGAPALGLRGSWTEGYAGGGASYAALYLFELDGDTLQLVFAAPMSMYRDIAGSWNDDGTRAHDMEEWARVLIVEPRAHHGHQDLRVRARGGRGGDLYRFDPDTARYRRVE